MTNKDKIRTITRKIVPKIVYKKLSRLYDLFFMIKKEGFINTYKILKKHYSSKTFEKVYFSSIDKEVYIRPNSEDLQTFIQNIIREEYGFFKNFDVKIIIDAGGFIGDSSLYFSNRFPNAKIYTMEPNNDNYSLAEKNLKNSINVNLLKKGLWSEKTTLFFGGISTGSKITDEGNDSIETLSINDLISIYSIDQIDILKMDIEGAELDVLTKNYEDWINKVKMFIIEFHGQEIEEKCFKVLEENGFSGYKYRSLYYFTKDTKR